MRCLTIDFTLEEPVLCTQLDGEPNSARTFGFVPGSVLRGALAARYAAAKGLSDGAALFKDADATEAFFAADVRYLNAYPRAGGVRLLPASQAWFRSKKEKRQRGDEAPIYDRFVTDRYGDDDAAARKRRDEVAEKANARVSGDGDTFAVVGADGVTLHTARRQAAIHTMRDRRAGRATEKFGAVFRYEALAPGQTLRAHVLVGDAGAQVLKKLLTDDAEVFVGKARTAGYGRARAQLVGESEASTWRESTPAPERGPWRLTLLSDALLRDAEGRPGAGSEALRAALAAATGVEAKDIEVTSRFASVRTVGGFNRTWGLPLPQVSAARMGSEYEIACAAWTNEHLRRLEQFGIGDRRSDGFGRIALYTIGGAETLAEKKHGAEASEKKTLQVNTPAHTLARQMAERLLRRHLDRLVMTKAQEIADRVKRPTVSQLKRMQAVVNDALAGVSREKTNESVQKGQESMQRLRRYMESIDQRASVRGMFHSGGFALNGASWLCNAADLHEWLCKRFTDDDKGIDTILEITGAPLPEVGGVKAEMTGQLRREYSLRLVHAVLGLAAKRQRRAGAEGK